MGNSITIGGNDVNSIMVGGSSTKLVTVGNTAIWQNFNPSFTRRITSTGATPQTTWSRLANNVTAFKITTNCTDVMHSSDVSIWVRLGVSSSVAYDFIQRSWDSGLFDVPQTSLTVKRGDTLLYTTEVPVAKYVTSGGGISWSLYWGQADHDTLRIECSIDDDGYWGDTISGASCYSGVYPYLDYACMPTSNGGDVSYYIETSSFK